MKLISVIVMREELEEPSEMLMISERLEGALTSRERLALPKILATERVS